MANILPLQSVIIVFFAFLIWVDQRPYLPTKFTCDMSFMYGRPGYYQIPLDHSIRMQFKNYALYLYTEKGRDTLENLGTPVLFIPGSSGSHEQVRSIATHTMHLAGLTQSSNGQKVRFTFFSVDLDEEVSALYGGYIWSQTHFVVECIKFLKNKFYRNTIHNKVIIVGHSMGGIVARGVLMLSDLTSRDIPLIITLATPHLAPPLLFDSLMEAFYIKMQNTWLDPHLAKPIVISIGGGYSDVQVSSDLIELESALGKSFSIVTTEIPRVWTVADHQCIVWCKQLQVLLAKCLVSSVNGLTGKMKSAQVVAKIFQDEIKYGFKTPKLSTNTIKCNYVLDSYATKFIIEFGNTCLSPKVLGTGYDIILLSPSANTTLIICTDEHMNSCTLHPPEQIEIIPLGGHNMKIFYITPVEHYKYVINVNLVTELTLIRNQNIDTHSEFLPTPFPSGAHSSLLNIKAHSFQTKLQLIANWPMHIAYRVQVSVQKCKSRDLTVVETSDGVSDKQIHTAQPMDFYVRAQRVGFTPATFELAFWKLEESCEYRIEITASWWVTLFNFAVLHLHLVTHWVLLAIAIQGSLDILSELEEQLLILVVCICIMFFQYGVESMIVLLFHFAVFSLFGVSVKMLQLVNLWLIKLESRSKRKFPILLFTTLFLLLGVLTYFCSPLGLVLLFFLSHLSYIGNKLKHPILLSWSLVLLLWLIALTIPSQIVWWRQVGLIGLSRLQSDTFLLHLVVCSVGVLMRYVSGEEALIPNLHIPYGLVSLSLIVLYSYAMYKLTEPDVMYAMIVSVMFAITQAL